MLRRIPASHPAHTSGHALAGDPAGGDGHPRPVPPLGARGRRPTLHQAHRPAHLLCESEEPEGGGGGGGGGQDVAEVSEDAAPQPSRLSSLRVQVTRVL
jgi:hypothetical protein